MQWIAMILPSFVSVAMFEMMEKKKCSGVEFIKCAGLYTLFTNLMSVAVYQYVIKTPTSILANFENNLFLIHYMVMNIFFAILLPILKLAANPYLHLSVQRRGAKKEESHEEQKR